MVLFIARLCCGIHGKIQPRGYKPIEVSEMLCFSLPYHLFTDCQQQPVLLSEQRAGCSCRVCQQPAVLPQCILSKFTCGHKDLCNKCSSFLILLLFHSCWSENLSRVYNRIRRDVDRDMRVRLHWYKISKNKCFLVFCFSGFYFTLERVKKQTYLCSHTKCILMWPHQKPGQFKKNNGAKHGSIYFYV